MRVYPVLSLTVAIFLGAVAVLAAVAIALPRLDPFARTAMKVGQFAALVVVALDVVSLLQGHEVAERTTHIGYAVATVGLPVLLLTRRPEEEDREPPQAHLGVVAVTAAAMVVLVIRLQQTWSG